MQRIIELMKQRALLLQRAMDEAEERRKNAPPGRLRLSGGHGYCQYYHVVDRDHPTGTYIRNADRSKAVSLEYKEYAEQFLPGARRELKALNRFVSQFEKSNSDLIYHNLTPARQKLVSSFLTTDEEYAQKWQAESYTSSSYMPEEKVYQTKRGEMVRSKSELLIADLLYEMEIPYRYEPRVRMKRGNYKYPDFLILNQKTRQTIYWEHMGLMDDPDYLNNNLAKILEYGENGICLGKNLMITFETSEHPLNVRWIRKILSEILG